MGSTVDLVNATGVDKIENVQSTQALTVNSIASLLSAGVAITSASAATTIEFEDDALAADDDSLTLELDGAGNAITVGSESDADGGIETYNVTATGADSDLAGNALSDSEVETLNVAGTAAMDFGTATNFDAATVIDATENSGGVTVEVGDLAESADRTFTGGSGADDIDVTALTDGNVGDLSVSLGEGDDTLHADDAIDIAEASYDGGDGTDTLAINEDIADGDATYSNFESIAFDTTDGNISITDLGTIDDTISTFSVISDGGTGNDNLTVNSTPDGSTFNILGEDTDGDGDADDDTAFLGILTIGSASAGTNSATVDFSGIEGEIGDNTDMTEIAAEDGRLTELTIVNDSGFDVDITDIDDSDNSGMNELVIEGDSNVDIVNAVTDSITAVDATGTSDGVDVTGGTGGGAGVTFEGGSGDDTYVTGANDDVVLAGAGDDTIDGDSTNGTAGQVYFGGLGGDTITLDAAGDGNQTDTVRYTAKEEGGTITTLTNTTTDADDFSVGVGNVGNDVLTNFEGDGSADDNEDDINIRGDLQADLNAIGDTDDNVVDLADNGAIDYNAGTVFLFHEDDDLAGEDLGDISDVATTFNTTNSGTPANAVEDQEILFALGDNAGDDTGLYYFKDVDGDGDISSGDDLALIANINADVDQYVAADFTFG